MTAMLTDESSKAIRSFDAASPAKQAPFVSITPFGRPVVPEE
jgi:hypothetical protein